MTDNTPNEFQQLAEQAGDTKIVPAHGVAAIALSMAMKYHDINTVHDGTLYQQYKLEGRNMQSLNLDMVFETAIRIERHLLESSQRFADIVVDALVEGIEDLNEEDRERIDADNAAMKEPKE